jgi:hypothetical protein
MSNREKSTLGSLFKKIQSEQCLQGLCKGTRADVPLTTAQWQCVESIAETIGWRPKGSGRQRRSRNT